MSVVCTKLSVAGSNETTDHDPQTQMSSLQERYIQLKSLTDSQKVFIDDLAKNLTAEMSP